MTRIFANLSLRQKITIAAAALLAVGGIYALVHHQREAGFKPLFTGVSSEDAAGIVQKLKESGVDYRLPDEGGSVLAPAEKLAELRLNMAAAGLPKTGRIGFELFDKTNLGATEFTEHINYRRALEGELERSIVSLTEVEQARVHLTFPKDSVFLESRQPAKASVMVKLKPRAKLAPENVLAINHLVSSAVEGLMPEAVSVLDMNGNLLSRPRAAASNGPEPSEAALDYRQKVEADLVTKINTTLEPLLGVNKFRAGVSADCDYAAGEQSEEIFDPARSVMLSSQRTEDSSGSGSANGVPGTSSSLPRPTSRPGSGAKNISRTTENITYQSSRTVKKTQLPAGGIRKISVAVLVDHQLTWERDKDTFKRVLTPPAPDTLKIIRGLVAGVTGFNPERGDQLVIESLPFENTLSIEPPEARPAPAPVVAPENPLERFTGRKWDRKMTIIAAGAGAGILLLLVLGFMRLRPRTKKAAGPPAAAPPELPPATTALAAPALPSPKAEESIESKLAEHAALQSKMEADALNALKLTPAITKTGEVLAKHLREKVAKDPTALAQILRTWIREGDALQ